MICDLAETYGIFDYRQVDVKLLTTLTLGLRENSRVKMALADTTVTQDTLLLAAAVDNLSFIAWTKTKGAQKGIGRPKSIVKKKKKTKQESDVKVFATPEEFEAARVRKG